MCVCERERERYTHTHTHIHFVWKYCEEWFIFGKSTFVDEKFSQSLAISVLYKISFFVTCFFVVVVCFVFRLKVSLYCN